MNMHGNHYFSLFIYVILLLLGDCVTSCKGQDPGFYQLCDTFTHLQCKRGQGSKKISCKGKLKWNPVKEKCTAKSKCEPTTTTTILPPTTATPIITTAGKCIRFCSSAPTFCSVFATRYIFRCMSGYHTRTVIRIIINLNTTSVSLSF